MKRRQIILALLALTILGTGIALWAQEGTVVNPQAEATQVALLSPQQLDNLVAPVALYPDPLLSQVLVASTYPLEVVEANQWYQRNRNLSAQALMDAAKQQPWDPSVQALVAVPDALARLNQDIRWTTDLGNAFLAQESDVMNAVQRMRAQAQSNGRLASTPQQTVTYEDQGGQNAIVIEPANPEIIYVPYYDPYYVWGAPAFGYYPPLFYPAYGFGFGPAFDVGFYFGGWSGWGFWGWGPDWFGHTVCINNGFFPRFGFHNGFRPGFSGVSVWTHDPVHRLGIPYANPQVNARFQGAAPRSSFQSRTGARTIEVPFANRSGVRAGDPVIRNQASPQNRDRYQAPVQRYQAPVQRYQAPVQTYQAPERRYQAPVQRYQAPVQRYQAPVQRYQAPVQRFQAPQSFRSAPAMNAPHFSGGGGGSQGRNSGGERRGRR